MIPTFHVSISGTVIALYAAVLSTFVGVVQFFTYIRDRSKIKVTVRHNMEMFGGSKYQGETLTIVYVENHGRRPVTINSVGARRLHPNRDIVILDVQPALPHELTEGKNLMAIIPGADRDLGLSTIDVWEATDAVGHRYLLRVASWREHFKSNKQRRKEWQRGAAERAAGHSRNNRGQK